MSYTLELSPIFEPESDDNNSIISKRGRQRLLILATSLVAVAALVYQPGSVRADQSQDKIEQAVLMLGQSESTKNLVDVRNKYNIIIAFGDLIQPENDQGVIYSSYNLAKANVSLDPNFLADADIDTIADALAHELTHAEDAQQGLYDQADKKRACLDSEFNANKIQGLFWYDRFGIEGKNSKTFLDNAFNNIARAVVNFPDLFRNRLNEVYEGQCNRVAAYLLLNPNAVASHPRPIVMMQPTVSSTSEQLAENKVR